MPEVLTRASKYGIISFVCIAKSGGNGISMSKINSRLKPYGLSLYKLILFGLCMSVCVVSLFLALFSAKYATSKNVICVLSTMGLLIAPILLGILMKFSINSVMFTGVMLYAMAAPLFGTMYNLYNLTNWWDDMLHFTGGVVFAILGVFVAKFLNKNNKNTLIMCAVFAFVFSMAISALWEIYEFSVDSLFGIDMQRDTIIHTINSKDIGETIGKVVTIEGIHSVTVNGEALPIDGYLDTGLIDTMKDMIVEGLGALAYCVVFLIDRDKHPIITSVNREKKNKKK